MTRIVSRFPLPPMTLGTERYLTVHTYGDPDVGPKAYLQGGIHAGELPGPLALHHLIRRLDAAEDEILGHIMIVPIANPVGQAQILRGQLSGRYSVGDGSNFNRGFPNVADDVRAAVDGRLGSDSAANTILVREAISDALAMRADEALTENDYLRITLLRLACESDLALDLHCEEEGLVHLYVDEALWPQSGDLAVLLDSPITLLTNVTPSMTFDEALIAPWTGVADLTAIGCTTSTVELRGAGDVGDALAEEDADRLYRLMQHRGFIAGGQQCEVDTPPRAVPINSVERVDAPIPGIISFRVPLGAEVTRGQPVADLIDPTADDPAEGRVELLAGTDGLVYARRMQRFASTGVTVVKIAGRDPVATTVDHHLSD